MEDKYKEMWIYTGDGQSMYALVNGDMGWLMYLPNNEGDSFSSRNPEYQGDEMATMAFYLSNGQCDEYPLSWVLPIELVNTALEYFQKEQKQPDFIIWQDDNSLD